MKPIIYSSPLYILLGQVGIPYGKPAIGIAMNKRVYVQVKESKQSKYEDLIFQELDSFIQKKIPEKLWKTSLSPSISTAKTIIDSCLIPTIVAGLAALWEFYTKEQAKSEFINNLTYTFLKDKKMVISGIENTTASFGGMIYFRKEFEFLKGIYQLPFNIPENIRKNIFIIPLKSTQKKFMYSSKKKLSLDSLEVTIRRMVISFINEDSIFFQKAVKEYSLLLKDINFFSPQALLFNTKDITLLSETMYADYSILAVYQNKNKKIKNSNIFQLEQEGLRKEEKLLS